MDQQRKKYKEPQDTLWGKCLTTFIAIVFAMSTLTIIPLAGALDNPANEQADAAAAAAAKEAAEEAEGKTGVTPTEETPKPIENLINDDEKGETLDTVESVLGVQSADEEGAPSAMNEVVPAEVQAFLDAVAAIPEITPENAAEVAEYVYGPVSEAYGALLGTEYEEHPDVLAALPAYAAAIEAVDAAMNMDSSELASGYTPVESVGIYPDKKPSSNTATGKVRYSNQSLTMLVGQKASFLLGAPTNTLYCGTHGYVFAKYNPSDYCDVSLIDNSGNNLVGNPIYKAADNNGERVFDTQFEALKPGTSDDVRVCYYANFGIVFTNGANSINLVCPYYYYGYYGHYVTVNKDVTWYRYSDVFGITVNARYQLNYDTDGGSSIAATTKDVASTSTTMNVTPTLPTKEGYTFQGWEDENGKTYAAGDSVQLDWSTGLGSADNPVSKTLKAKWEKTPSKKNLTVSKTPSEEHPIVGKEFFYTIRVTNPNSDEIKVKITDQLNENLDFVAAADGGSYDRDTRTVTWTDVTVPANGNKEVKVYVKANAAGEIYNEARIECDINTTSGNTTVTAKNPDPIMRTFKVIYYNESGENWMPVEGSAEKGFLNMPEWQMDEKVTENPHSMTVSTNVPTRDGYTFDHWQWGGDVNSTLDPGDTITLTANPESLTEVAADLFAVWTKNPVEHTVTYTWSGLPDGHNETLPVASSHAEGTEVAVDTTYPQGKEVTVNGTTYVFSGWSVTDPAGTTINNNNNKFNMPNTNVTVSGSWSVKPTPTHTVTVRYMCDVNNNSFTDTVTHAYTLAEGETYDHSVDSAVTTYPLADGFNSTVKSPLHFKTSPTSTNTWVFDEVLTTDALTGTMPDHDIVINVWYTKDNKGSDANNPSQDASDGTPDKYQAKVVYAANEGGSQNGVNAYATIMENGKMATEGTIAIAGATATPDANHHFVNWTAVATGHDGWNYSPVTDTTLPAGTISAKGNAVYTFTANFDQHGFAEKKDSEGHTVWADGKAPDCIHDGTAIYECSCGATVERVVSNSALGHDFTDAPWSDNCADHHDANCTGHTQTCTRCNGSLAGGTQVAAHSFGDWTVTKQPTATERGQQERTCTSCGHIETQEIAALGEATITVRFVDENGTEVGTGQQTIVTKGGSYDVTEQASQIPAGYVANGNPTGDPLSGTADGDKTITVPVQRVYTVTYTDGVDDAEIFADQVTNNLRNGATTPAFNGILTREGYTFTGWSPEVAATVTGNATYTAQWAVDRNGNNIPDEDEYRTVTYTDGVEGTEIFADQVTGELLDGDTTPSFTGTPTREGYVFAGWTPAVAETVSGDTIYTATWDVDAIGNGPNGTNQPDGIADKYQVVVTYAAINGTIDGTSRYVLDKRDATGNLAEDGAATLTAAQIPGTAANEGYGPEGTWAPVAPVAGMQLTADVTAFVITYAATPEEPVVPTEPTDPTNPTDPTTPVTPTEPTNPGDGTTTPGTPGDGVTPATPETPAAPAPTALAPVAAAAPAAAAAAAEAILDDGNPLGAPEAIDDDANALAAFEEIHCWTHWLMIFGALVTIVYGLAVLYRRRHDVRDMDDFEGDIMDGSRRYSARQASDPAANGAFQAM